MTFAIRAAVVLCLGLTVAACDIKVGDNGLSVDVASGRAADEWTRSYKLPKGGRLEIINVIGSIDVSPAAGPDAQVVASREVRTRTDEEARARLAGAQMVEDVGPDHVRIEMKAPDQNVGFGPHGRVSIRYHVSVPAGLVLSFRNENGAIRVENVDGRLTLASTNGPIVGRALSGSVDASTVNGGIEIGLTAVTGDSKIVTVNGPATLVVGPDVDANLEAAAVNGGVTTEDGLPLTASDRTNRRVVGRLNDGGPRIAVQTTNGGVRVGTSNDFARGRGPGRRNRPPTGG